MNTSQIYDKTQNKTLDVLMVEQKQAATELQFNHMMRTYTHMRQLGLDNTATLYDIVSNLPRNSRLVFDYYKGIHTGLDVQGLQSGQLEFIRTESLSKIYIRYIADTFSLVRCYNSYYGTDDAGFLPWEGVSGRAYLTASAVSNKVINIKFTNINYYFASSQSSQLTDLPSGLTGGFYAKKEAMSDAKNPVYLYTLTTYESAIKRWISNVDDNGNVLGWVKTI